MKNILTVIMFLALGTISSNAQKVDLRLDSGLNDAFIISTNSTLTGSRINFKPGLGIGYMSFMKKSNMKTLVEYSQWSQAKGEYNINEFRFNFRYEFDRYINNWFSIGAFASPEFRYSDNFYPNNDTRNFSEVDYALSLGLSPKIYRLSNRYYFSLGLDLPIIEAGYFQGDGPDPEIGENNTLREGLGLKVFQKNIRAVATFGYRF
ncbi:hypothetical protein [Portibacter lacus]|uniref:DUF3575 domain-containing protein n=1 Tax=Portibacter lacus TaxID=1099794 RepID=A0AA37SXJ1_9BACT|nr:hypothetical protein [Portibacter lacus]GLR19653.1 hypothetical protein GCM10007940_42690 [Portibacter lacus]